MKIETRKAVLFIAMSLDERLYKMYDKIDMRISQGNNEHI